MTDKEGRRELLLLHCPGGTGTEEEVWKCLGKQSERERERACSVTCPLVIEGGSQDWRNGRNYGFLLMWATWAPWPAKPISREARPPLVDARKSARCVHLFVCVCSVYRNPSECVLHFVRNTDHNMCCLCPGCWEPWNAPAKLCFFSNHRLFCSHCIHKCFTLTDFKTCSAIFACPFFLQSCLLCNV